jgi:hypothetical protein
VKVREKKKARQWGEPQLGQGDKYITENAMSVTNVVKSEKKSSAANDDWQNVVWFSAGSTTTKAKPRKAEAPELAHEPRILDRMAFDLERAGLVGETRTAKLVYLLMTSRVFDRPLSAVIRGQSSAGKNHVVGKVRRLFPDDAYVARTSISPKALAYMAGKVDLSHRILIVEEAAGFKKGDDAVLLRCLISEGYVHHDTVIDGKLVSLHIDGPVGLLVTTTSLCIEEELENRMFSIPINDSPEQTKRIMVSQAMQNVGSDAAAKLDPKPWLDLQAWLQTQEHRVVIPFAERLAQLTSPVAVRLRRDFPAS